MRKTKKKPTPLEELAAAEAARVSQANLQCLRDEFARTALAVCVREFFDGGMPEDREFGWPWLNYDDMAMCCWSIADAMLRNRVKPETLHIRFTKSKTVARARRRRDGQFR